jgi:L-iditol 2-dehydrogenase
MSAPRKIGASVFPYPKIPLDAAMVRMEMSGICGTDKHMFIGETEHPSGQETNFPIIPGHENVGIIEELGENATGLEVEGAELHVGDRVVPVCDVACGNCYICRSSFGFATSCLNNVAYGTTLSCRDPPHLFGGWAEYLYVLPQALLAKVPEDMSVEAAVMTEVLSVALCGFNKAVTPYPIAKEGFGPGDVVVILGAGPLGICHGIMAKMMGAQRIVIVGAPEYRLRLAEKICADQTLNIERIKDPSERVEEIKRLTNNRGADLVAECAGVPDAVSWICFVLGAPCSSQETTSTWVQQL